MRFMTVTFTLAMVLGAGLLQQAAAGRDRAKDPEAGCRAAIVGAARKASAGALAAIAKCHAKRDKTGSPADCNVVDTAKVAKALGKVGKKCAAATCTQGLYGGTDIAGAITAAIESRVESSGAALVGSPALGGDKAKAKCHTAVAKAWKNLMGAVLRSSLQCEAFRRASCSPLDASCGGDTSFAGPAAERQIAKACGGLTGTDVGACTPLPSCLVDGAKRDGNVVARNVFGGVTECGNGKVEGTEQCDDGNTVDTDGCTNQCKTPVCGDGIQSSTEPCDDGNNDNTDGCIRRCADGSQTECTCAAAACGDGFVRSGVEACDDGNTSDTDACSNACTIPGVACGANGIFARVALDTSAASADDVRGLELRLSYPTAKASLPVHTFEENGQTQCGPSDCETGADCINTRIVRVAASDPTSDDLTRAATLCSAPPQGDALRVNIVEGLSGDQALRSGPIVEVQFSCTAGTLFVPSELGCAVPVASDTNGVPIAGVACSVVSVAPQGNP